MNTALTGERAERGTSPLVVSDLGLIDYETCWDVQRELVQARSEGRIPDTLLLLEHPHTFTCGRRGGREHILATEEELSRKSVTVLDVDRGGDVTYHGPGQLVAYSILNLAQHAIGRNLHAYVRSLEQVLIDTLAYYSIKAGRLAGFSGAWYLEGSRPDKVAAIGVKVDGRLITSHGIALNVSPDLSYFDLIVPCGISDKGVTSMSLIKPPPPPMEEVKLAFAQAFAEDFGYDLVNKPQPSLPHVD
jgi:lipoate-protein ligase B